MVLWEIALGTAYFLGLKRTYRLALKLQRRVIPTKHLKFRRFSQRRTRAIFNVVLKVHQNIKERDIAVGQNMGNWILRWFGNMEPSANICGATLEKLPPENHQYGTSMIKQIISRTQKNNGIMQKFNRRSFKKASDRLLFSFTKPTWPTSFPSITKMMRYPIPTGSTTQYRQLWLSGPQLLAPSYGSSVFGGFVREDIKLWMKRY